MKIVVAHNRYRSALPSGENVVVDDDIHVLRDAGVDVVPLIEESDDIPTLGLGGRIGVATGPVFNAAGVGRMRRLLSVHHPDLVHVHNVFPLLSPWIVRAAHEAGVPVVQTVHNFRQDCVAGTHRRDERDCFDCEGHNLSGPAVRHGCYRGSRIQSGAMAVGLAFHRQTWNEVELALAPSEFVAAEVRKSSGARRVIVRPHSTADPGPPRPLGNTVLFVGRLEPDKGIRELLDAWRDTQPPGLILTIVGAGSLTPLVTQRSHVDSSIRLLGTLGRNELARAYRDARIVVQPSRLRETFGMTVIESLAHGRPVIVARSGALPELIDARTGWVWSRDESLGNCLRRALHEVDETMARHAYRRFIANYTREAARDVLLRAYDSLISPQLVNA